MNRLRTMTAVGLSAAAFAGGCGETQVDPQQQKMNQVAQKAANSAMKQLVAFANSDRVGNDLNNDPVVDEYVPGLGGKIAVSKLVLDRTDKVLDCEDQTPAYFAEVRYDDEEPSQASELTIESYTGQRFGDCKEEDRYTTVREFERGDDGNWTVEVFRDGSSYIPGEDSNPSYSFSRKQAETVGAVREIAADAQKDIELLLADEPR